MLASSLSCLRTAAAAACASSSGTGSGSGSGTAAAATAALRTLSSAFSSTAASSSNTSSSSSEPTTGCAATHAAASTSSGGSSSPLLVGTTGSTATLLGARWHQLQQAARYRAPVGKDAKAAKTKGKASKGASGAAAADSAGSAGAGSADADAGAAAATFTDDAPHAGDAVRVLLAAIDNVTPHLEVRTRRAATKTIFVPGAMPRGKARSLALHWLVRAAEARKKGARAPFAECLALEVLLAYQKRGAARQKRDELHKVALQNRANLHMRWW